MKRVLLSLFFVTIALIGICSVSAADAGSIVVDNSHVALGDNHEHLQLGDDSPVLGWHHDRNPRGDSPVLGWHHDRNPRGDSPVLGWHHDRNPRGDSPVLGWHHDRNPRGDSPVLGWHHDRNPRG